MNSEAHTTIFFFPLRADSLEQSTQTSKYTPHCSHIKHSVSTHQFPRMNWLADPDDVKVACFSWHRCREEKGRIWGPLC